MVYSGCIALKDNLPIQNRLIVNVTIADQTVFAAQIRANVSTKVVYVQNIIHRIQLPFQNRVGRDVLSYPMILICMITMLLDMLSKMFDNFSGRNVRETCLLFTV